MEKRTTSEVEKLAKLLVKAQKCEKRKKAQKLIKKAEKLNFEPK